MDSEWWLQEQPEDPALNQHNDNAANLDCIMDHLFLGGISAATNPMLLEVYSIQAIINATKHKPDPLPEVKNYKQIPVDDDESENIEVHLEDATKFIHDHVEAK